MNDSALSKTFEPYDGYGKDFYFHIGPAGGSGEPAPWDRAAFAEQLRRDVEAALSLTADAGRVITGPTGDSARWYDNDELLVSVNVGDPEGDPLLDRVPALLMARSRSQERATWELAADLYRDLCALGTYLVIVDSHNGDLVTANFDVGDDW
ncbi:hypothetical protein [Streptomyces cyaneofuscatus]|uniref:hypothetical protein n=1 Tax=Streptomyces cyaneofuscatus TaxID=66883 RepID=UPI0036956FF6